ncbi:MAG: UDP-N-acetylenolpyruvoylglucosamine reductase [Deltaproteobacteria bacterium]|nr:MAG: UDP-N-acetylenolpyruvoylglucosamine reductase [Deltaproteobacteria bacterium]
MISHAALSNDLTAAFFLRPDDRSWLKDLLGGQVQFDVPMERYTTLGVGGPADALATPTDTRTLEKLVSGADQRSIPWLVVGGGSNLLVKDGGIRGIVILLGAHYKGIAETGSDAARPKLRVKAGTRLSTLCRYTIDHGLAGLGFALGIPGSVGGSILMNAGTAGGSIQDVLTSVSVLWPGGRIERIEKKDLVFGYRRLTLPGWEVTPRSGEINDNRKGVIVDGVFVFEPGDAGQLKSDARRIKKERRQRQPLGKASAGCFFKNPVDHPPAGRLIDLAGLKGNRVGDAQVSMQHGNFIINRGKACAADILNLAEIIENQVLARFGVQLEPEVIIVGESNHATKSI